MINSIYILYPKHNGSGIICYLHLLHLGQLELELGLRLLQLACRVLPVRREVQGSGFRVQGSGFRVQGSGSGFVPVRREARHALLERVFAVVEFGLDHALIVGGLRQLVLERAGVGFGV